MAANSLVLGGGGAVESIPSRLILEHQQLSISHDVICPVLFRSMFIRQKGADKGI